MVNNCPKLYFSDYHLSVILYTDADYAHGAYLCHLRTLPDGKNWRAHTLLGWYLSGPTGPLVHYREESLNLLDLLQRHDLVGGVHFSSRTDHRNLVFMNNHRLRKVLKWKLDIQHYETIDNVPGKANIPTDAFSWLDVRPQPFSLHYILVLQSSPTQRKLIERFHTYTLIGVWDKRLHSQRNTHR